MSLLSVGGDAVGCGGAVDGGGAVGGGGAVDGGGVGVDGWDELVGVSGGEGNCVAFADGAVVGCWVVGEEVGNCCCWWGIGVGGSDGELLSPSDTSLTSQE